MEHDDFDQAVTREAELTRRLEEGSLTPEQAHDLRQLAADPVAALVDFSYQDPAPKDSIRGAFALLNLVWNDRGFTVAVGDVDITADRRTNGVVVGSVVVEAGVRAVLDGTVTRNVVIERDAEVLVRGSVWGEVVNRGGTVTVTGEVRGGVRNETASQ